MSVHTPDWPLVVGLQQRATLAEDEAALAFLIANDTWQAVPYAQACLLLDDALGRPGLSVVSGLVSAHEETPYKQWLEAVCRPLLEGIAAPAQTEPLQIDPAMLDDALRAGWSEWWPPHALLVPLATAREGRLGAVVYLRDTPWEDAELALLRILHIHYAGCLARFRGRRRLAGGLLGWLRRPRRLALIGAGLLALALCPVRLSIVAPAEIIALQAEVVSAPADGVIKQFQVAPNQPVKAGQLLFTLDDTTLRNRREVAARALAVARADALSASQKAFDSAQSRGDLAALQGRVREREAELAWVDDMLTRTEVRAAHDGVFIYGDPNDWLGKPVQTGERIAQLAQPDRPGVLVWVPVGDAIALDAGAPMRVFLQTAPLDSLEAELIQTSYQAGPSPEGIAAYRVRGRLREGGDAHIGLRGVAKIYGNWQPLGYWVLRRPLGSLRQWVGL